MLSRFHLIPEHYGRTDRRTDLLYQYRASVCWRAIKIHSQSRRGGNTVPLNTPLLRKRGQNRTRLVCSINRTGGHAMKLTVIQVDEIFSCGLIHVSRRVCQENNKSVTHFTTNIVAEAKCVRAWRPPHYWGLCFFMSTSLYFSKRGAYWDRLCRDVVGRWSLVGWLVGWLVVTRVHCGQTVHPRPIVTMEH